MWGFQYDPKANALYVTLGKGKRKSARQEEVVEAEVILDFDKADQLIGVEILLPQAEEET